MPETDEAAVLLKRIGGGDRDAMRVLYDTHGPDIHRFIQTRLRDAHEAADALQETMMEIWRRADTFEGRSSARTWMFGIARNKAIDRFRRTGRTVLSEPDETIPDGSPSPDTVLSTLEDARHLRECVERLRPNHRAAIQLAYFRDLPLHEIAEIEACPLGTIKTRLHHAKKLLMHCLAGKTAHG
ncbi:putative RNA polymerase sigma factor [Parvularcula bermudensis HTCC2503]|uniref:Putative RNA polymerase sigma factor n=1 Tax=Parvularcula bermudensis (strain ATCC BAA-594 / HTCC2503 / KCTC 12087) TaxID=314260 RepID=E0TDF8_PARBH|nr:sigma-70 family RNA polymerase sigma factor [Parvularcula bermudensis]ADM10384.1 putative RNA polymerase sigma factor [Parvularcula bermudensis HTCC2503]